MNIRLMAAVALTAALLAGDRATAACAGPPQSDGICGDRELVALHQAAEVKLKRLLAAADPLTALLMRRDQRWLMEVVRGMEAGPFDPKDAPERLRKKTVLEGRLAALDALTAGAVPEGVSGRWINALGTAKVEKRGDGVAVEVAARPDYGVDDMPVECALTAVLKLRPDGWYAGTAVPEDSDPSAAGDNKENVQNADASPPQVQSGTTELRLRLQGNTLRLIVIGGDDADFSFCTGPEMITGTYFPAGAGGGRAGNPARTVAPSFDCAVAKNQDEEEICADPDLARLDVEIASTYRDTLRRLDAKLASHLRNDQRAWAKGNTDAFDTFPHPYWDKQYSFVNQTGAVRSEWETRMAERLAMLANLDETRAGLAGHWLAYNARLAILPAKDKQDGTMRVEGSKWVSGSHKDYCDFDGEGRVVDNGFKPSADVLPKLRRDGATLTVDGDDPDPDRNHNVAHKRRDYCSRLGSAKARLFPVKPTAYQSKDRIR